MDLCCVCSLLRLSLSLSLSRSPPLCSCGPLADLEDDDSGPVEQVAIEDMDGPARPQTKVNVEDFDLLKVLGKGSFGKVMQVM